MQKIEIHIFGNVPDIEFEPGGRLHGFDVPCDWDDIEANRDLYDALGVDPDDQEHTLTAHEDGRIALVGLTMPGHRFAIKG